MNNHTNNSCLLKLLRRGIAACGLGLVLAAAMASPGFAQSSPIIPGFENFGQNNQSQQQRQNQNQGGSQNNFVNEDFVFQQPQAVLEQQLREEAFEAALEGLMPLRPQEIRRLLEHYDRTQESVELPVYPAPRPEMAVEHLSTDPGSKPTVIKVAHGYVTTLNIVDATGSPWPIEDITWAGNFEIVEFSGENSSHFIRITPQSEFAYGNMSIHMLGLQTPIIISLETSREMVHYRFDAIIPDYGPMANVPLIDNGVGAGLKAGDVNMASLLSGVPPQEAERLNVSGVDGRTSAYRYKGLTYLRTPLTLLSPSWIQSTTSADGTRVYAMNHAPVLLLSNKGKMVRAHLSVRQSAYEE